MYYIASVLFLLILWCPCMATNVSVQYNGGLLPDITVDPMIFPIGEPVYQVNAMKRFCICSL